LLANNDPPGGNREGKCLSKGKEIKMKYESLLELFQQRRSIRKYKDEPVPEEYIQKILEAARWAPSGANKQPWEFVVIRQEESRKKIIEILTEQFRSMDKMEMTKTPDLRIVFRVPPLGESVYILPFGDPRTLEITNVYARITRGVEIFTCDMANTFLYMVLAANSLGLGARWLSAVTCPFCQTLIKDYLGIPQEFTLFDMLVLGFPDEQPYPKLVRNFTDIIHYEKYDPSKYRTQTQLREFLVRCFKQKPNASDVIKGV
jgi:predicted oxidoreductase (fatty acid repression mutant protein)